MKQLKKLPKITVPALAAEMARSDGFDPQQVCPPVPGSQKTHLRWTEYAERACLQIAERNRELEAPKIEQDPAYANAPIRVYGEHEQKTIEQLRNCMRYGNVFGGILCADGHYGYSQPVGGVVAYDGMVSPSGVGYDIACGNMAEMLDTNYITLMGREAQLLADIRKVVSFGVGRVNNMRAEHPLFDDAEAWRDADAESLRSMAAEQLGTVGGGNHYVDLLYEVVPDFYDSEMRHGRVWIGVHFGSRGLGHKLATKYILAAGGKPNTETPVVLRTDTEIGRRYLAAMSLAGRYAYAGRAWVCEQVRKIIGGRVLESVHNHHNYAWLEEHNGTKMWVVRKGATPSAPGQRGFIGGSMGDDAVIVEGYDNAANKKTLYSTVHGAGREFGRAEAKRRFTRSEMDEWLRKRGVVLSGGDLDESPMAYRRLSTVLEAHSESIKVVHTLRPFAVAMAGEGEFDPFKD